MATGAVVRYLQEVFSQPSFYDLLRGENGSNSSQNGSLGYNNNTEVVGLLEDTSHLPMSAAHFGLATGLLAILLNSHLLSMKFLKTEVRASEIQRWAEALLLRTLFAMACLLLTATVAPVVAVTFVILAFYRQFVHHALSLTNTSFASLLEGTDAVWALEDDASKSIINVLAIFEVEIIDNVFKPQLLGMLRKLMRERVLTTPESCPKFWQYRRHSKLGYFYWENQKEVKIEDHIQYMTQEDDIVNLEAPDLLEDSFRQEYYGMSESVLKGLVSELANSPLPYDNAASWEMLVGRDPILEDLPEVDPFQAMEEGNPEASGRYRRYPILFRVHHSMGDGVALIRLLLDTLADKKNDSDMSIGIRTTKIVDFSDEGMNIMNRKKSLDITRLDNIDVIKCSAGSFDDLNRACKTKRPTFLDLNPSTNVNLERKIKLDFLENESDDTEGNVHVSIDHSKNIFYKRSSKPLDIISSPSSVTWDKDTFLSSSNQASESTYLPIPVGDTVEETYEIDVAQRELFWYTGQEISGTQDENITSAKKITLDHTEKKIFFDNTKDVENLDDEEYLPPLSSEPEFFRDLAPSPPRCQSPLPPFRRDVSRIARVMDKIPKTKSTPFLQDNHSPPRKNSPVPIVVGELIRSDSPFLKDRSPPKTAPQMVLEALRANSPCLKDEDVIIRTESPVPKIHRKKYPVLWNDLDTDLSPPTARKDVIFSRSNSPFQKNGSVTSNHINQTSKFDAEFQKNAPLKLQNDNFNPRSYSPLPRYNSSIVSDNSISRSDSPFQRNCSPLSRSDHSAPRSSSPFQRNNTPIPRNDHPVPRCNSPFQRNNSPIPRNDNPIPRCNSPFQRNSSPLSSRCTSPLLKNVSPMVINDRTVRSESPFQKTSPTKKQLNSSNDNELELENCNASIGGPNIHKKQWKKPVTSSQMQDRPLTPVNFDMSPLYTEHFIKGYFFSPDGEVINKCSASPNCFLKLLDSINHRPSKIENICSYVKNTCSLAFTPASLIHQTLVKAADVNPLHGPVLSGQKVVSWYFDSMEDKSDNLLSTIKRVKSRMSDARFTDVFLCALSSSLESFFLQGGCDSKCIPEAISVVIPVRMTTPEEIAEGMALDDKRNGKSIGPDNSGTSEDTAEGTKKIPAMENKFSVGLLSLPITSISTQTKLGKSFSSIGRLREICKQTDLLRKSPDYHINYWLMRVVSTFLPLPLLAPLLNSTQSTMVVSNLLGPPTRIELGGYKLKDIVFWVPNRGLTGVGVSVLSYAGRLQVGIMADCALISCQQDANIILEGITSELRRLDNFTAPITTHPQKV